MYYGQFWCPITKLDADKLKLSRFLWSRLYIVCFDVFWLKVCLVIYYCEFNYIESEKLKKCAKNCLKHLLSPCPSWELGLLQFRIKSIKVIIHLCVTSPRKAVVCIKKIQTVHTIVYSIVHKNTTMLKLPWASDDNKSSTKLGHNPVSSSPSRT